MTLRIQHILMVIATIMFPQTAIAAEATGDWAGTLEVNASLKLRLAVHIEAADDGTLRGTMDSLDQGAHGIALAEIAATPDSLSFTVPAVGGKFQGRWDAGKKAWSGQWSQGGSSLPLVLTAAPPVPAPAPLPANWSIPADDRIREVLEERIAARAGAGFVVGVVEPAGRRVVAAGPAGATGFDGRTIFEIGSVTKVFTALLLADMVVRGEVSLDDPAEKFLPPGARMPERGRKITLRDLANHRSGLPRLPDNLPMSDPEDPYADYTEALLLDFLARHQLARDVGSEYEYSNLGMGLLGYLLARRSGTDYASLLRDRVTGPLGMKDTVVALDDERKARFAQGHDIHLRPAKPWNIGVLAGAGALRSSAEDLMTFIEAFLGDRQGSLAPAMKLMLENRWPAMDPRFETGLGWLVAKSPAGDIVMHDGGTGGYRTSLAFDPAKSRGVVVLTNAAVEPAVNDLSIHLLVGSPLAPLRPIPPAPAPSARLTAVDLPVAELDRVAGRYDFGNGLLLTVAREGESLFAQLSGQPRFPIFAEAPLRFFWKVVDARLRFVTDQSGVVTGTVLQQAGQELTGKRLD